MKLTSASDYRFVVPDEDAGTEGRFPFSGDIMPIRKGRGDADWNKVKYEDICFLQEACGELVSALMYFSGGEPSYFPYGSRRSETVPRIMYGAAVGRFGPDLDLSSSSFIDFWYHEPYGSVPYLREFLTGVGTDAGKLFSAGMAVSPRSGKMLADLVGYADTHTQAAGYSLVYPDGDGFFDLFYALVTMAGSLKSFRARANVGINAAVAPASFGSYDAAVSYLLSRGTYYELDEAKYYEGLSFHDGIDLLGGRTNAGRCTEGYAPAFFISPDMTIPSSASSAVMTASQTAYAMGGDGPKATDMTYSAGQMSYTGTEIAADDALVQVQTAERKGSKLANWAFAAALGTSPSAMETDWSGTAVGDGEVDVSALALSKVVSHEMVLAAFGLPGICTRAFIPRFKAYGAATSERYRYWSGSRYASYEDGAFMDGNGPVGESQVGNGRFPGGGFEKSIRLDVTKYWSSQEEQSPWVLNSEDGHSEIGIYEQSAGPTDGRVKFGSGGGGTAARRARDAALARKKGGSCILQTVNCTAMLTVEREVRAWTVDESTNPRAETVVSYSKTCATYPIRYSLSNPELTADGVVAWTPSKTDQAMIAEAIGHFGATTDTVFATSLATGSANLPNPEDDPRLPACPSPSASPSASWVSTTTSTHYAETMRISWELAIGAGDRNADFGIADIAPWTADQTA